jgi:hypothetical protein
MAHGRAYRFLFPELSARSTNLRIAAGRVKSGSFCFSIQASNAPNSVGGKRTLTGVASIRGRPLFDFLALDIDFMIFWR